MKPQSPVRRQILLAPLAGLSLAGCGGAGTKERELRFRSLAQAREELETLVSAKQRVSSGGWNWAQTLVHCAQSIEFSMVGFPQLKSRFFQATAGSAAFALFELRGRMSHDRTEPIPGASKLELDSDEHKAVDRLRTAMAAFDAWQKELQPHFAYGQMTKPAYELAHAMHLADHLSLFRAG